VHDLAFADSARPVRVVCLRLLLKPYSIGHEILLWRSRNPLLIFTREYFNSLPFPEQCQWLKRAVLICCRDWTQNQYTARNVRLWEIFNWNVNWPLAIAEFRNYLDEGRATIPCLSSLVPEDREAYEIANGGESLEGGRPQGGPMAAQLFNYSNNARLHLVFDDRSLWSKLFGSPFTPFDVPFSIAANLYFAQLENEGALKIENFREADERAAMQKHRADVAVEKKAATEAWTKCTTDPERVEAIKTHPRILDLFPESEKFIDQIQPEEKHDA
jgi:hypothetical protein